MKSELISLRAIEPADIEVLYNWENNHQLWHLSNTITPFSRFVLEQYLIDAIQDIFTTKQLKLIIELSSTNEIIGCIDLFDFDPIHKRAGIGVLINECEQKKGYASEALKLLIDYAFIKLDLHQLYSNILTDNKASIQLFQKYNFVIQGEKIDWIMFDGLWKNEYLLQLIKEKRK